MLIILILKITAGEFNPSKIEVLRLTDGPNCSVATVSDVRCRRSGVRIPLGGLRVNPFQVSGGKGTLQSRASGLQSTTQGIPSGPTDSSELATNSPIRI